MADGLSWFPIETDSGSAVFLVAADDPGADGDRAEDHRLQQRRDIWRWTALPWTTRGGLAAARSWRGAKTLATLGRSAFQLQGARARGLQMTAEYAPAHP